MARSVAAARRSPLLSVLLLAACVMATSPATRCAEDWEYTIRAGDNLWTISARYLRDHSYTQRLQALSRIRDPHQIPVGTRVRIPTAWLKEQPATARVVAVRGAVKVSAGGKPKREAAPVQTLSGGDTVETGDGATVTMEFPDGSRLTLLSESLLLLETLRSYANRMTEVGLRLLHGRTENIVPGDGDPATRYRIMTPAGVTSVRGTDFRVGFRADERVSRTEVLQGLVGVANAGRSLDVPAGFGTFARVGQPPSEPVKLLPAPQIAAVPGRVEQVPAELPFPAVPGAAAYRTQLAVTTDFASPLADKVAQTPIVSVPELPNARYILRVRAIDSIGLEGMPAERALVIQARPSAPAPLHPAEGAALSTERATLKWVAAGPGYRYHLQVSRSPDFSELVIDATGLEDPDYPLQQLPPGLYYWRVASNHPDRGDSPFGAARDFRQPPPRPSVYQVGITHAHLSWRWRSESPSRRYRVQLARDPQFEDVLLDTVVSEPRLDHPRPQAGVYFLRVRAVEPDGYEGPFGAPRRIEVDEPPLAPALLQRSPAHSGVGGTWLVGLRGL